MARKLKIVIGGYIGLYPTGGVTWDYLQYPLGLKLMGHEVYYIEDTVQYSRYQKGNRAWDDPTDSIDYLQETMERFGFRGHWAYRDVATGKSYGMSDAQIRKVCDTADLFINISASTFMRDEYLQIPLRLLIDSDPMFTQIEYHDQCQKREADNEYRMKYLVEHHTHHATFGEHIGQKGCCIPTFGFNWFPTRQPVCLSFWENEFSLAVPHRYTTVMNWSVKPPLQYNESLWGQKNNEFEKVKSMPALCPSESFEVMMAGAPAEKIRELRSLGWAVSDALHGVTTTDDYQRFIFSSKGEFSVAKETYVKSRSGWFSCRSACYLAASRPVVTQETGWSNYIPSGQGLFAFQDMDSARTAFEQIQSNYKRHSQLARQLAHEYFDHHKVLSGLIDFVHQAPVKARKESMAL